MERLGRRRVLLVFAVIFVAVAAFWMVSSPLTPDQVLRLFVIVGILYAIFAGFAVALSYVGAGSLRRFAPLLARAQESAMPFGRGPTFLLDNGLLASFRRDAAFLTLFFGPDETVLRPTLADALRWMGPLNLGRTAIVRSDHRRSAAHQELVALQDRLGAGLAVATVKEPKAQQPGWPRWVVSVSAFRCFRGMGVDRFAADLDEVASSLRALLRYGTSSVAR